MVCAPIVEWAIRLDDSGRKRKNVFTFLLKKASSDYSGIEGDYYQSKDVKRVHVTQRKGEWRITDWYLKYTEVDLFKKRVR